MRIVVNWSRAPWPAGGKTPMEFLKSLLTAQTGTLLIIFGMVLLLLAVVGAIQGLV
jgi:hypothetical protein